MGKIRYAQKILVTPNDDYIYTDKIFLNTKSSNRFFKTPGNNEANQAKSMLDFLRSKNVEIKTMIDLGAHDGHVSLYFSIHHPTATILAVEASQKNYEILKENCSVQNFPTKNIITVNEAVSDRNGFLEFSQDMGSENRIISEKIFRDGVKKTETVKCDTLASFMDRFHLTSVDFLKIDLEGSEPLLYESIKDRIQYIRSVVIEIANKTDHQNYIPLLRVMWDSGMRCFDNEQKEIEYKSFEEILIAISNPKLDLWFIRDQNAFQTNN